MNRICVYAHIFTTLIVLTKIRIYQDKKIDIYLQKLETRSHFKEMLALFFYLIACASAIKCFKGTKDKSIMDTCIGACCFNMTNPLDSDVDRLDCF